MKKILPAFLFLMGVGVSAQSLSIFSMDSMVTGDATVSNDIFGYAVIENIGNTTIDVRFKRIDKGYNALTDSNAICWGLCFTPDISVSPPSFDVTMAPGDTTTAITHVYPDQDGFTRSGAITYVAFDANNPTDSVAYEVMYSVQGQPIGIRPFGTTQLDVYPNPARERLTIDYRLAGNKEAQFELINLLGSKVYETALPNGQNSVKLNIERFAKGVYFYRVISDGETLETKRLVIE